MTTMVGVTRCARHPDTETGLRCQKCETPICPRCMVLSPVGARCPDCAKVLKSPIYTLNRGQYVRAGIASLLGGLIMGALWGIVLLPITAGFGWLGSILFGIGLGYVFIRVLNFATGYKRGTTVTLFASAGIVLAWAVMVAIASTQFVVYGIAVGGLLAVGTGIYFAYQNLSKL